MRSLKMNLTNNKKGNGQIALINSGVGISDSTSEVISSNLNRVGIISPIVPTYFENI